MPKGGCEIYERFQWVSKGGMEHATRHGTRRAPIARLVLLVAERGLLKSRRYYAFPVGMTYA